MMNTDINVPVLLIGFNRPDVMRQSFEYIRNARPAKLYVAIDGARDYEEGEDQLVTAVKEIVSKVDWECETHYRFNDQNRGAELTISSAVSWVLENEEFVIVLEDDIIAPMSFLKFAQDMLLRYRNIDEVYMISSCQTTPIDMPNNEDYLFGIYGHIWGWATWKRAWNRFDLNVDDFDKYLSGEELSKLTQNEEEKKLWRSTLKEMKKRGAGNNTWDVCWSYVRFKENGLSIIPRVHLSSNIGAEGLHSKGQTADHYKPFDANFTAKIHPKEVARNLNYDNYHFNNHINRRPTIVQRAVGKILRTLKLN